MAKKKSRLNLQLVRWSKSVPASEAQDPLGLGLRGSTRIASRLLYCITSVTPRARYFSFIPWCIYNYQQNEKGQSHALQLREAIVVRERALTMACILHHEGDGCDGPGLNGIRAGKRWFSTGPSVADPKKQKLTKNSIINTYYSSLVNLGCFVTDEEREDLDEELDGKELTFDDIELSPLGLELAKGYDSLVGRLDSVKKISAFDRKSSVGKLRSWGKRGGLCELANSEAPDRASLQDLFFAEDTNTKSKEDFHVARNRSLVLILELCRQLSADDWLLDVNVFGLAVYYDEVISDEGDQQKIEWPAILSDTASRWRMFYFHYYMAVALEGIFAWVVTQVAELGLAGTTAKELSEGLDEKLVNSQLIEFLSIEFGTKFGDSCPKDFFGHFNVDCDFLDADASKAVEDNIRIDGLLAEHRLEEAIRKRTFLYSSTGLAVPIILLVLTLARFRKWSGSDHGNWLANVANNPYLDLVPPVLLFGLDRHFGDWWNCPWKTLSEFIITRYVVQQHQAMSYVKTAAGERCLLQLDGNNITADLPHEKVGIGNPRMKSAIQILTDLALIEKDEDEITRLTDLGQELLRKELAGKVQ